MDREHGLQSLRNMITFLDQQAMAESYGPFAQNFLAISKLLAQLEIKIIDGEITINE